MRRWAESCDVVALQEVDEALRGLFRAAAAHWVESAAHVDARGQRVDSCVAIWARKGVELLSRHSCELRLRLRGRELRRGHVAAVLQGASTLAVCSLHLHPPQSVQELGKHGNVMGCHVVSGSQGGVWMSLGHFGLFWQCLDSKRLELGVDELLGVP